MKKLYLALALFLPIAAACGDDDDTDGMASMCTTDADCSGANPVCDFRTGMCVIGCDEVADCGGTLPTCNATGLAPGGINTMAPQVCVCSATSCPMGQACLADGSCGSPTSCGTAGTQGTCAAGQVCGSDGLCAQACATPGQQNTAPCGAGQICLASGLCETTCDNQTNCIPNMQLCNLSTTATTSTPLNMCGSPDELTGSCTQAGGLTREPGGPIIESVVFTGSRNDPNCTGMAQAQMFAMGAFVYSANGLPTALFTQGVRQIQNGMEQNTFSAPMVTMTSSTSPMSVTLTFELCLSTAQMMRGLAVALNDADGNRSNAFCFTGQ